ncbi:MAG: phage portal protein [Planctomycetaceae bacterium]
MGLIRKLFAGREQRSWSLKSSRDELADIWEDSGRSYAGVTVTDKKVVGVPPIWRGLNVICDYVAKLQPELHDAETREVVRTHPLRKILRKTPNGNMSAYTWRHTSTFHLKFYGNAYSKIIRNPRTLEPESLILLDPTETIPFFAGDELKYRAIIDGEQEFLDAADVHHVKGLSVDGIVGLCMVELMAPYLGGYLAAIEWFNKYFENGTSASGVLMLPGHLRKEAVKNAIKSWNEMATGVAKRGRIAVTQDGAKYQPLSHNAEQAQLEPLMKMGRVDAALMIGVMPHMVGSDLNTSYASLEEQKQDFLDSSLDGTLCAFEEEHELKLLSDADRESLYIEYNRDGLLRASVEKRNASYSTGRQWGWLTRNDVLRAENRPTIGPAGDTYLMPVNMVEVDAHGNIVNGTPKTMPDGKPIDPEKKGNAPPQPAADPNTTPVVEGAADPKQSLTGTQITSLLEIIMSVVDGKISKETAVQIIVAAFPFDEARAKEMVSDIDIVVAPKAPDKQTAPPVDLPVDEQQRTQMVSLLAERLERIRSIEISKLRKLVGRGVKGFTESVTDHYGDVWKLTCLAWGEVRSVSGQSFDVTAPLREYYGERQHAITNAAARSDGGFGVEIEEILKQWEADDLKATVARLLEGTTE